MSRDEMRFVRGRCRECGAVSPVCDQLHDVHRRLVGEWWERHKRDHEPELDWEIALDPVVPVLGRATTDDEGGVDADVHD